MDAKPTAAHLTLFHEIYDVFHREGTWPIYLYIENELDRKHDLLLADVLPTVRDGLLRVYQPITDDRPLMLRIAGMLYCDGVEDEVALFIRALRWCVQKRATFQVSTPTAVEYLQPSTDEAVTEWTKQGHVTTPLDLDKLHAMFAAEMIDVSLNGSPGDWTWDIHKSIRRFRPVRDVYGYLKIVTAQAPGEHAAPRLVAPMPMIAASAQSVGAGPDAELATDEPAVLDVDSLHPLVRDACARLFASEHYRQGVLDAALVLRDLVREKSGLSEKDDSSLMGKALGGKSPLIVVADLSTETGKNVQRGTSHLAQGILARVRNVLAHEKVELPAAEAMEMAGIISRVVRDVMSVNATDAEN